MTSGKNRHLSVYFVRHGEAEGNMQNIMMGQLDYSLTGNGEKQAHDTALSLKNHSINLMVSSPLKRAKETAEIIANSTGYPGEIVLDDRLKERDMGTWQGKPSEDFFKNLEELGEERFQAISDMESLEELRDRAISFANWLTNQNGVIIVVGHHAYSKMLRTVIAEPEDYKNAFNRDHINIPTGSFIKLEL